MRNAAIATVGCLLAMIVASFFYEGRVHEAVVYRKGIRLEVEVGWPATINAVASWGLIVFSLGLVYLYFKQDLKKPALAVSNEGLFINQQVLRNAFLPWSQIASVELRGHSSSPVLRVFFKDVSAVLQGQSFILKSIAKATLNANPSMGISKHEVIGDLIVMFDFIKEKGVTAKEQMVGRTKEM